MMIEQFCGMKAHFDRVWARAFLVFLSLCMTTSPSLADEPEPLSRRARGDLAIRARAILKKHCSECHVGPDKRGTIAVLEHSNLVAASPPVPFVRPKNVPGSQVIQFIEDGTMPPGNRPRLESDEIANLKQWIMESAPSYPAEFDEQYTLKVMLDDLGQQPAQSVPYLRYISLAHLVGENGPLTNLGMVENNLRIGLKWCNPEAKTPPVPVDDSATLFRFDTRSMGWESRDLFFRATKGAATGLFPLTPYDLILLEYPFGFRLPPEHPQFGRLNQFFKTARQIQPVPFLRADWLAVMLAKDKPLADDLRGLLELRKALDGQGNPDLGGEDKMPCGPKVRAFSGKNPVSTAPRPETGLPILPLGAWYSGDCQAEPAPFSLKMEAVNLKLEPLKTVSKGTPFQFQVTTNRDKVYFVLLYVSSDRSVVVLPTQKNGFIEKAGGSTVLTPVGEDGFKIPHILTDEQKANEYFILLASLTELPATVIVKSRHAPYQSCEEKLLYPISRFFFDPETRKEGFDPSRVVRVVVPIEVKAK